jgi:hypothetical protein
MYPHHPEQTNRRRNGFENSRKLPWAWLGIEPMKYPKLNRQQAFGKIKSWPSPPNVNHDRHPLLWARAFVFIKSLRLQLPVRRCTKPSPRERSDGDFMKLLPLKYCFGNEERPLGKNI